MKNLALAISIIISSIILTDIAIAGADIQQTTGGNPYYFYYSAHKYAEQEFTPTMNKITKVELKVKVDYMTFDPCIGNSENIDVEIRDSSGRTVAYYDGAAVCGLSSDGWDQITLTQTQDLAPGQKYKIRVYYRGYSLLQTKYFAWDRATSSRIAGNSITPDGTSSADFAFKTYGIQSCTHEYFCEENTRYERMTNCQEYFVEDCGECSNGACVTQQQPSATLTGFDVKDSSYNTKTSFNSGETAKLYASVGNTNGISGTYNIRFDVTKNGVFQSSKTITRTAPSLGLNDAVEWSYTIPSGGNYRATATVDYCQSGCSAYKDFSAATNTCSAGWICVGNNTRAYRSASCSMTQYACTTGRYCSNGQCVIAPVPATFTATSMTTTSGSTTSKTTFLQGERLWFRAGIRNLGNQAGTATYTFSVLKDNEEVYSIRYNSSINAGATYYAMASYTIPSDAVGSYSVKVEVEPCSSGCERQSTYTVNAATPILNLLSAGTKLGTTIRTSFIPGQTVTLYGNVRNTGNSAGQATIYYDVLKDETSIYSSSAVASVQKSTTATLSDIFQISSDMEKGIYQLDAQLVPCYAPNNCRYSKLFSINSASVCSAGYRCVNSTHRVYQNTYCNIGTPYKCSSTTVCQDGNCVTACDPASCGINAGCNANQCGCDAGYGNCDGDWNNGCEVSFDDNNNCGGCGLQCQSGTECRQGNCEDAVQIETEPVSLTQLITMSDKPAGMLITADEFMVIAQYALDHYMSEAIFPNMSESERRQALVDILQNSSNIVGGLQDTVTLMSVPYEYPELLETIPGMFIVNINGEKYLASANLVYAEGGFSSNKISGTTQMLDAAGGALFFIGSGVSFLKGVTEYNGSIFQGIITIGEDMVTSGDAVILAVNVVAAPIALPATVIFFVSTKVLHMELPDWYTSTASSLVKSARDGVSATDNCFKLGDEGVIACMQTNWHTVSILSYPWPIITEFNVEYGEGSSQVTGIYKADNRNFLPYSSSYIYLKIEAVTDKQTYSSEMPVFSMPYVGLSGELPLEIGTDERLINVTLTSYTGCMASSLSTCQWYVNSMTKEYAQPEYPVAEISTQKETFSVGEPLQFTVKAKFNGEQDQEIVSADYGLQYTHTECQDPDYDLCQVWTTNFLTEENIGELRVIYTVVNSWGLSANDTITVSVTPETPEVIYPIQLLYPADGGTIISSQGERFQWQAAENVTRYRLVLSDPVTKNLKATYYLNPLQWCTTICSYPYYVRGNYLWTIAGTITNTDIKQSETRAVTVT